MAEERHFGRAASRLHLTQPALSRTIARLERTLDVRLFERTSRAVALSPIGELLVRDAVDVLERADRFVDLAQRAGRGELGTLRAAVPVGLPAELIAAIAGSFRGEYPDVTLALEELAPTTRLPAGLDAAFVVADATSAAGRRHGVPLVQRLGVLLSESDPLATRGEIHPLDLGNRSLVILPVDQEAREAPLLTACRQAGLQPREIHRPRQSTFAFGMLLAGDAVAFAEPAAATAVAGLVWRPAGPSGPVRRQWAVWRGEGDHGRGSRFAQIATDVLISSGDWHVEQPAPVAPAIARPGAYA